MLTERNHTIEFQMNDTACDRGTGIYKFVEMVTHKLDVSSQSIHAVIGRYIYIYIESLMSCHLLLNLLHELTNMILCEALPSIISFLPTNVINLVIYDNEFEILFIT